MYYARKILSRTAFPDKIPLILTFCFKRNNAGLNQAQSFAFQQVLTKTAKLGQRPFDVLTKTDFPKETEQSNEIDMCTIFKRSHLETTVPRFVLFWIKTPSSEMTRAKCNATHRRETIKNSRSPSILERRTKIVLIWRHHIFQGCIFRKRTCSHRSVVYYE